MEVGEADHFLKKPVSCHRAGTHVRVRKLSICTVKRETRDPPAQPKFDLNITYARRVLVFEWGTPVEAPRRRFYRCVECYLHPEAAPARASVERPRVRVAALLSCVACEVGKKKSTFLGINIGIFFKHTSRNSAPPSYSPEQATVLARCLSSAKAHFTCIFQSCHATSRLPPSPTG